MLHKQIIYIQHAWIMAQGRAVITRFLYYIYIAKIKILVLEMNALCTCVALIHFVLVEFEWQDYFSPYTFYLYA